MAIGPEPSFVYETFDAREVPRLREEVRQLRLKLAKAEEARDAYFEAIPTQKPDPQHVRENDELARGILELQRKLTQAEQGRKRAEGQAKHWREARQQQKERTKLAEERWEALLEETRVAHETRQRAEGNLATAYNLAEMWRQRYEREKEASKEWRARYTTATSASAFEEDILLPLAYFPAGEDPAARWGLTELGERALRAGAVKGPGWVLLVSPDPREVLSIAVRVGSRQETLYRAAGYVSADAATAGGNFLGLLEAFVEVAKGEDEELGKALHHMETLYCMGVPMGTAVRALEKIPEGFAACREDGDPRQSRGGCYNCGRPAAEHCHVHANPCCPGECSGRSTPSYDLAAICARCGETYGHHLAGNAWVGTLPCDGFLAVADFPAVPVEKMAGVPHESILEKVLRGSRYDPSNPEANADGWVEDVVHEGRD